MEPFSKLQLLGPGSDQVGYELHGVSEGYLDEIKLGMELAFKDFNKISLLRVNVIDSYDVF
jgi:hypothetical protein